MIDGSEDMDRLIETFGHVMRESARSIARITVSMQITSEAILLCRDNPTLNYAEILRLKMESFDERVERMLEGG